LHPPSLFQSFTFSSHIKSYLIIFKLYSHIHIHNLNTLASLHFSLIIPVHLALIPFSSNFHPSASLIHHLHSKSLFTIQYIYFPTIHSPIFTLFQLPLHPCTHHLSFNLWLNPDTSNLISSFSKFISTYLFNIRTLWLLYIFYLLSLSTLHSSSSPPTLSLMQALTIITNIALKLEINKYTLQLSTQQISHSSCGSFTLALAIFKRNLTPMLTHQILSDHSQTLILHTYPLFEHFGLFTFFISHPCQPCTRHLLITLIPSASLIGPWNHSVSFSTHNILFIYIL
jgi:hypothetical protein